MTHRESSRDVKVPFRMIGGGMLSICWAKDEESLYFLKLATFTTAKYRMNVVLLYLGITRVAFTGQDNPLIFPEVIR